MKTSKVCVTSFLQRGSRPRARRPMVSVHKTALSEFYRVAFPKKVYSSIDELQADLDLWILEYNEQRPHQHSVVAFCCQRSGPIRTAGRVRESKGRQPSDRFSAARYRFPKHLSCHPALPARG